MRKCIGVIAFCTFLCSLAQKESTTQTDHVYYKVLEQNDMYISSSVYRSLFGLAFNGYGKNLGNNSYFLPNEIGRVSVGVSHPIIPFNIAVGIGMGKVRKAYPKTKSIDIQIQKFAENYVLDAFYQNYRGFYVDRYHRYVLDKALSFEDRSYPKLDKQMIGFVGQYIFNHDEFSYQAAYNTNKVKQLKSSGSFLAGVILNYINVRSMKPIISDLQFFRECQYGVNGGYTYNYVMNDSVLFNVSAVYGANINSEGSYKSSYLLRASGNYTNGDWVFGTYTVINILPVYRDKLNDGTLNVGNITLKVVRKIKFKKKYKKLLDIIK